MAYIDIAVIADRNVEAGLHVTLLSLMENLAIGRQVRLHLFLSHFEDARLRLLQETLSPFERRLSMHVKAADALLPKGRAGIRGSAMPFALLSVPTCIRAERVLILDADLLFRMDAGTIFDSDLGDSVLAAVRTGNVGTQAPRERQLLNELGYEDHEPYFNTGVVVCDTARWAESRMTEECLIFTERWRHRLMAADQSAINALALRKITPLPDRYNVRFWPNHVPARDSPDAVFHFIGFPKPWDLFAKHLHEGYPVFDDVFRRTALESGKGYRGVRSTWRALRNAMYYNRIIRERVRLRHAMNRR